jgi:zinc protease
VLPGKSPADAENAVDQEIGRLQKEPVGQRELAKVKNQLEAGFIFGQDSLFYQAMVLAQHEIARGWRTVEDYVPAIRKVSAEDVQRVAQRYLTPDNRTVAILIPTPSEKPVPLPVGATLKERVIR